MTTVLTNGSKSGTKVFAGGALIASQSRYVNENNQTFDSLEWTTADPVTGTVGNYRYTSEGNARFKEETGALLAK